MEQFDIDIRNFAFGGEAYGVLPSGKGCFVRGAAPGENVTVEILSEHARFVRARLVRVNKPAPERIEPLCPHAADCPGCSFGHITYEKELLCKQEIFERFLAGTGAVAKSVIRPPVPAPRRYGWRNKIRLTVQNGVPGYKGTDNVTLVPVRNCALAVSEINAYLETLEIPSEGTVELRYTPSSGVLPLEENQKSCVIFDTLPGFGDFPVPAGAFFQTNPAVAALLVEEVMTLIRETGLKHLTELHCGAGMFSLCAALRIGDLVTGGAEITESSVLCARRAAKLFKLSARCHFTCGSAAGFYRKQKKVSLLLVDPPRAGLDGKLLNAIIKEPPERMIYVSCGPDTLQRDIKKLVSAGARVLSTRLFDMFPATAHFESVTLLAW